MIYIDTKSTDPYFNFGVEYYFASEKKLSDTVFLFWQTSPTLMVGKYQNVFEEINLAYAREHGINVVRRLSGGGTIYTDPGGYQYTFIESDRTGYISFDEYIDPVIYALESVGAKAVKSGRNDIVLADRKISGNAQYKLAGSTVHHGSLLFSTDIEQMVRSSTPAEYKITSKSIKSVRDRVINIGEHIKPAISCDEFKNGMIKSILSYSGAESEEYILTPEDLRRINELAEEKFKSEDAIYGNAPKFEFEKTCRFSAGTITFYLTIKNGVICDITMTGDFFSPTGTESVFCLIGTRFRKDEILSKLKKTEFSIYGISNEEIAEALTEGI